MQKADKGIPTTSYSVSYNKHTEARDAPMTYLVGKSPINMKVVFTKIFSVKWHFQIVPLLCQIKILPQSSSFLTDWAGHTAKNQELYDTQDQNQF